MIQSPVQCLGCRKSEEHSNVQMLLPSPRIRQIDSNALMTSAPSVNQKHVTGLQKGSNVPYHGYFVSMKCWNLSENTPANTLPLTINKSVTHVSWLDVAHCTQTRGSQGKQGKQDAVHR